MKSKAMMWLEGLGIRVILTVLFILSLVHYFDSVIWLLLILSLIVMYGYFAYMIGNSLRDKEKKDEGE